MHVSKHMTGTRARWNDDEPSSLASGRPTAIPMFPAAGIPGKRRAVIVRVTEIVVFNLLSAFC